MSDYTDKEELDFIESLYNEADKQIKEVYQEQKNNRDELLKQIASIMLAYTILNDLMKLSKTERKKEYNRLSNVVISGAKGQGATQIKVIEELLTSTANKTFNFYSYNKGLKDVREIIGTNFRGKHFSKRVWDNEDIVAKHLHKQVNDFLNGKVNVNQIKKNIEKTYNSSAYNTRRLVDTEVSRVHDESFKRFCKETGVERVRYLATLDRTCSICMADHEKIFNSGHEPDLPRHPLCHCFYDIADDMAQSQPIQQQQNDAPKETGIEKTTPIESYNEPLKTEQMPKVKAPAKIDAPPKINNISDLTESELKAVTTYTQTGSMHMNSLLRGEGFKVPDWAEGVTNDLKAILNKSELSQDIKIYRGVSSKVLGDSADLIKADPSRAIGLEIKDKGFISTSKNVDVAERFVGKQGFSGDNILMELKAPKGYNALEVGEKSLKGENEVILRTDSKIKITAVEDTRTITIEKVKTTKWVEDLDNPIEDDFFGTSYEKIEKEFIEDREVKSGYIKFIGEVVE